MKLKTARTYRERTPSEELFIKNINLLQKRPFSFSFLFMIFKLPLFWKTKNVLILFICIKNIVCVAPSNTRVVLQQIFPLKALTPKSKKTFGREIYPLARAAKYRSPPLTCWINHNYFVKYLVIWSRSKEILE